MHTVLRRQAAQQLFRNAALLPMLPYSSGDRDTLESHPRFEVTTNGLECQREPHGPPAPCTLFLRVSMRLCDFASSPKDREVLARPQHWTRVSVFGAAFLKRESAGRYDQRKARTTSCAYEVQSAGHKVLRRTEYMQALGRARVHTSYAMIRQERSSRFTVQVHGDLAGAKTSRGRSRQERGTSKSKFNSTTTS